MLKIFLPNPRIHRGATWYIEWQAIEPISGQPKRQRKSFNLNRIKDLKKREAFAQEVMQELLPRIKNGYPYEALTAAQKLGGPTITAALQSIVEFKCSISRPDTIKTYRSQSKAFLKWMKSEGLETLPIDRFSKGLAQRFLDTQLARKISPITYNNYLRVLKGLWNAMIDREVIERNPWQSLRSLPKPQGIRNRFSPAQTSMLIAWMSEHDRDLLAYICLMLYSGIRVRELTLVRIGDIDFETGIVSTRKTSSKKKELRQSTIPAQLLPFLKQRAIGYSKQCLLFGKGFKPGVDAISVNMAYARCKKSLEACGFSDIPGLTLNSWRHTGASIFVEKFGISIAQRQLGHSSPVTTQRYSKPSPYIAKVANMDVEGI